MMYSIIARADYSLTHILCIKIYNGLVILITNYVKLDTRIDGYSFLYCTTTYINYSTQYKFILFV